MLLFTEAVGHLFLMAPSEGVRCRLRVAWMLRGTCVGVRDWRGFFLKLSRCVFTRGLSGGGLMRAAGGESTNGGWGREGGGGDDWGGGAGGGVAALYTNSSSLSERSKERVELQSDTEERESRVTDAEMVDMGGGGGGGGGGARCRCGESRLNSLRVGGLVLRRWLPPPPRWKRPSQRARLPPPQAPLSAGDCEAPAAATGVEHKSKRLKPSPTAANMAPQPSSMRSERRPTPGLG